ncbi:MAG: hypothetical protein Q7J79_08845, partial [Gemmatimonadales bacterium]|nr:hypothetical protein [Gemmatimonadales bacterium]
DRGLRGLLGAVRRLFGRRPGGPPRTPPRPADQRRSAGGKPDDFGLRWMTPPVSRPEMRWQREGITSPYGLAERWAARATTRQRVLVALAAVSVVAMAGVLVARLSLRSTLPPAVRGVWGTVAPNYSTRRFELRAGRVAFQVGDSAVAVTRHLIQRVRTREVPEGMRFNLYYLDEGAPVEFSFVYSSGPPEEIRFANQPRLVWTRAVGARPLLPDIPY